MFVTGLHGLVERRGGAGADWSRLALAAGATLSAIFVLVNVLQIGLVLSAGELAEPSPAFELAWQLHAAAFALALPARVYAADGAREAIMALKAATGRVQRPVFTEFRDLYRRPLTTAELDRFDAVVLDPPRAGARDQVVQLAASKVARIAYVSCNPGSFARDAKILCDAGWRLEWVQPVGQFRWSTHVELASRFVR